MQEGFQGRVTPHVQHGVNSMGRAVGHGGKDSQALISVQKVKSLLLQH